MKKLSVIFSIVFLIVLTGFGNPESTNHESGIQFYNGDLKEALVKAKKEGKIVFLDVSTSWCGYCKLLKSNTFKNQAVSEYYNAHFISLSIDAEKGNGPTLARKYNIYKYPAQVFFNQNGEMIYKSVGYRNPKKFIELGKSITKKQ